MWISSTPSPALQGTALLEPVPPQGPTPLNHKAGHQSQQRGALLQGFKVLSQQKCFSCHAESLTLPEYQHLSLGRRKRSHDCVSRLSILIPFSLCQLSSLHLHVLRTQQYPLDFKALYLCAQTKMYEQRFLQEGRQLPSLCCNHSSSQRSSSSAAAKWGPCISTKLRVSIYYVFWNHNQCYTMEFLFSINIEHFTILNCILNFLSRLKWYEIHSCIITYYNCFIVYAFFSALWESSAQANPKNKLGNLLLFSVSFPSKSCSYLTRRQDIQVTACCLHTLNTEFRAPCYFKSPIYYDYCSKLNLIPRKMDGNFFFTKHFQLFAHLNGWHHQGDSWDWLLDPHKLEGSLPKFRVDRTDRNRSQNWAFLC